MLLCLFDWWVLTSVVFLSVVFLFLSLSLFVRVGTGCY